MNHTDLRVLFIVDAIQGRNGVGTYFQDLINQIRPRVAKVELVAPSLSEPHPVQGISFPLPGDSTQRLFFPKMGELIHLANEMKPNVIVVPGPGVFSIAGLWLATKIGVPVCMTHQTDYPNLVKMYWPGPHGYIAQKSLSWMNKFMARSSENVVTISEGMLTQLHDMGIANPNLVGTSLSPEFISKPIIPSAEKIRRILFLGRLAAEKNIDHFLELAELRSDLIFTIAGDGPLREEVIRQQEKIDNLHFLGWRKRGEIPQLIDDHDLLILPSSVEAFGTVAMEAMARKRLVMTNSACGINQWQELASGLIILKQGESLLSGLQRIEKLMPLEKQLVLKNARDGALHVAEKCTKQWLNILTQTAVEGCKLSDETFSPAYSLIKRYMAA